MTNNVYVNGSAAKEIFVNNGSWQTVKRVYVKDAGVWRTVFPDAPGSISFGLYGQYSWTVPNGVYQVLVTVVGAGGGGGKSWCCSGSCSGLGGGGGGGGGLVQALVAVTPGWEMGIGVGNQGTGGITTVNDTGSDGAVGGDSWFIYPNIPGGGVTYTVNINAQGGRGGKAGTNGTRAEKPGYGLGGAGGVVPATTGATSIIYRATGGAGGDSASGGCDNGSAGGNVVFSVGSTTVGTPGAAGPTGIYAGGGGGGGAGYSGTAGIGGTGNPYAVSPTLGTGGDSSGVGGGGGGTGDESDNTGSRGGNGSTGLVVITWALP